MISLGDDFDDDIEVARIIPFFPFPSFSLISSCSYTYTYTYIAKVNIIDPSRKNGKEQFNKNSMMLDSKERI